jgi:O-antigen/teichoic acid export membrane protein
LYRPNLRTLAVSARLAMRDSLHRSSLLLLANTAVLSGFAFVFWSLAAHLYPAAKVGHFSALIAGTSLLTAVATLGFPNVLLQQLGRVDDRRELILLATAGIAGLGGLLCVFTLLVIGPALPSRLHLTAGGLRAAAVVILVLCTSISAATDAGLIALRGAGQVLTTNIVASVVKVALVIALTSLGENGLLTAYVAGALVQAVSSFWVLWIRVGSSAHRGSIHDMVRTHFRFSAGNYVGGLIGILPDTLLIIVVLYQLGPQYAAWATSASLFGTSINFIPANTAQALYAELRLAERRAAVLLRSALKAIYVLTVPLVAVLVVAAPVLLRVFFGAQYSTHATGMLRVFALSGLVTGMTYVIDTFLLSRGHLFAYIIINAVNATFVLGLVVALSTQGLTSVGLGWTLGQGASVIAGLTILRVLGYRLSFAGSAGRRTVRSRLGLLRRSGE